MATHVIDKVNSRLRFLYRQNNFLNIPLRRLLCNAMIQPIFDNACNAWYPNLNINLKNHLQAAQNKCIRFCLKLCDRTSIKINEFEKINWPPNHNTTYSPKKYYDNRRTWNLIKTAIIVIIFSKIRSNSSYHGHLIGRFQSQLIQHAIQNTGHVA